MTFDFQAMRPLIQAEFDEVCASYPTDMSAIVDRVPEGGDELERKLMFVELGVEECPVHIFRHYPFAFEVDVGEVRDCTAFGVAKHCVAKSGVDFGPLRAFQSEMHASGLCSFNDFTD